MSLLPMSRSHLKVKIMLIVHILCLLHNNIQAFSPRSRLQVEVKCFVHNFLTLLKILNNLAQIVTTMTLRVYDIHLHNITAQAHAC